LAVGRGDDRVDPPWLVADLDSQRVASESRPSVSALIRSWEVRPGPGLRLDRARPGH
jgi:hypothetical protein